jgi:acyl-ACP thioesterase
VNNLNVHLEKFQVRSSEVDPHGKMKLQSVCDLLQEVAGNHALKLNFDISRLQAENLTWVLHRLHIQMHRYPDWREYITIKTWPSSGDTLRAFRDFQLLDAQNREIGRALSYWLMLNTQTRRPVRMPAEVLEMAPRDASHVLDVASGRIPGLSDPDNTMTFNVRRSDLDINRHVNNVRYIEWAMEALPPDAGSVREFDIEFHAECIYGDTVLSEISVGDSSNTYLHGITKKSDSTRLAVAQSRLASS